MSNTILNETTNKALKKTASYLIRRALRLRKKSKYVSDNRVKSSLLHNAERDMKRANALYVNVS